MSCGLAIQHIELLTGQPAGSVRTLLNEARIMLRGSGGRSPFLRVMDTPRRIPAAFAVIDELTAERGLVTSQTVPAIRAPAPGRAG